MSYLPETYTQDQIYAWMKDEVFGNQQVIVAEVEGTVVGYASVSGKVLSNLYVLPDLQRRGVGSKLLKAVLRQVPNGLEVWVFEANIDARRFYERHGFRTLSCTSGDNDEGLPDQLMVHTP